MRATVVLMAVTGLGLSLPAGAQVGLDRSWESASQVAEENEEQNAPENDDPFAAFDDELSVSFDAGEEVGPQRLDLKGYARLASSFGVDHDRPSPGEPDWRGLSRLRLDLQLELEAKLGGWKIFAAGRASRDLVYKARPGASYPDNVVDAYEKELDLREVFIRGRPGRGLTFTAGRQIIVWGRSDTFRVTDIVNPLDLREPGLVDIEDLRLPVGLARLDLELGRLVLGLLVIPEVRFDKSAAPGHDLYPGSAPLPSGERPSNSLAETELGLSLDLVASGWDLSLYAASVYDDRPSLIEAPSSALPVAVDLEHRRLELVGAAASLARGSSVYFLEAALVDGVRSLAVPGRSYSRLDLLAGVEYTGLDETTITVEVMSRRLNGHDPALVHSPEQIRRNDLQTSIRVTRDLLHDRLQLVLLSVHDGLEAEHGSWQRLTARLELAEGLSTTVGVVVFNGGDGWLEHLEPADRILLELRYDF